MELKQLYKDTVVLCKTEVTLPTFLLQADLAARRLCNRYPKRLVLGQGEYITPLAASDAYAVDDAFYTAVLYRIAGSVLGSAEFSALADAAEEDAYKALWRAAARGKRRKGDVW